MKRMFLSLLFVIVSTFSGWAVESVSVQKTSDNSGVTEKNEKPAKQAKKTSKKSDKNGKTEITMTSLDAVKLAGKMVEMGDYEHATQILTKMPQTKSLPVEIERWYLLAQMEQRKGNYDEAIKIYRKILDSQPDLSKIRYELALCYMAKEQWYRADYHLRLAMAGKNIPEPVKQRMMYYRYIARKNKNWNVWFNFGAAPDNNINQATGGQECIGPYWFFVDGACMDNPEPEKAVGYNLLLGGNYEFKLSDHWRWKNDANIYTNVYNKHKYDDLYLAGSTGPRYVWENGDVWLAGILSRRWYGWDRYNWAYGAKIDTNYDLTRKLSSGLTLRVMNNKYDEYWNLLNGQTWTMGPRFSYSFDASKYVVLRGAVDRETAKADAYANWRYNVGVGFGAELLWGFSVYLEPSFTWVNYDGERYVPKDGDLKWVVENDFIQRYSVSLSNNKFSILGMVPTLTCSYTKKDSNIHNRQYEKTTLELTFQQRF